jgi:hypothetical protein
MATARLLKQHSISRDGLMTIKFTSNVRDFSSDVRRSQINTYIKTQRDMGIRSRNYIRELPEDYSVFNSDPDFNIDNVVNIDDMLNTLTVVKLKEIMRLFNIIFSNSMVKDKLIQLIKMNVEQNPRRLSTVRQYFKEYISQLRSSRERTPRDIDTTLLISNQYKYTRSHFDGMSFKEILRSLFDIDDHLLFLYKKILKEKEMPKSRANSIIEATKVTQGMSGDKIRAYIKERSDERDRILKLNSELILNILFKSRRPFYINKKKYTILDFHQENESSQNPSSGIELAATGKYIHYAVYPVIIYFDLTDVSSDKITDTMIRKSSCYLNKDKIRENWHAIWNRAPESSPPHERKHRRILQRSRIGGNNTRKNTKTYVKSKTRKNV